jgi:hypothetical protein
MDAALLSNNSINVAHKYSLIVFSNNDASMLYNHDKSALFCSVISCSFSIVNILWAPGWGDGEPVGKDVASIVILLVDVVGDRPLVLVAAVVALASGTVVGIDSTKAGSHSTDGYKLL